MKKVDFAALCSEKAKKAKKEVEVAEPAVKKTKKAKKEVESNTDQFGNREGSQAAKINSFILEAYKGITVEELIEATKLPKARVMLHVHYLVKKVKVSYSNGNVVVL